MRTVDKYINLKESAASRLNGHSRGRKGSLSRMFMRPGTRVSGHTGVLQLFWKNSDKNFI